MAEASGGAAAVDRAAVAPGIGTAAPRKSLGTKRCELRRLNVAATKRSAPDDSLRNLDSSLKRHTSYTKRLRTSLHAPDSVAALLKETSQLQLDRYLSEIVAAVGEGLGRCKKAEEVWGAVEVISALHQRFPTTFTSAFSSSLLGSLSPPSPSALAALPPEQKEREEASRVVKQRGLLRCLAELDLVGVVAGEGKEKERPAGEVTFGIFKDLLTADKEALVTTLPLAVSFTKQLSPLFLPPGSVSTSDEASFPALEGAGEGEAGTDDMLVSGATKEKFRKLLGQYFEALSRKAVKDHLRILETERRNSEAYIKSGTVFEDRAQAFEKMTKEQEKLWTGVLSLAEVLGLSPPDLPSAAKAASSSGAVTSTGPSGLLAASGEEYGPRSLWADEEEKRFYVDLLDLRDEVPGIYLGAQGQGQEKKEKDETTAAGGEETAKSVEEEMERMAKKLDSTAQTAEGDPTGDPADPSAATAAAADEALPAAPAAQLTALFARLPDANGRDVIDKAAVEFAYLNSKAARKRLVKFLGGVSRSRLDLIPYYARMAATLARYMPDVATGLVAYLEEEFRYLQRKRGADMTETRAKNTRFLAELTKFNLVPSHSILHAFKVCVDDLAGPNVDNLCNLMEGCGRWLLRTEVTREKTAQLIEQMKRKKASQSMDQRSVMMLENAYYQCDPPERLAVEPKKRSPVELYIRHMIYDVLTRKTAEKVVKLLRKLHWEDPEMVRLLKNIFTKVWKMKFANVHLLALVLHDLSRFHPEFTVQVVDQVLEDVRVGMEQNIFKHNQRRVASMRYLGELYNYRVVDSKVVLDTLWSLVTFCHPEGRPWPEFACPIDPPDDFFRARLVCTLLATCGTHFDRGSLRKRLDNLITFFIMYLRCKQSPPMDIDFLLQDTFEQIRPKVNIYLGYEEAAKAVDEMLETSAATDQVEDIEEEEAQVAPARDEEPEEVAEEAEAAAEEADGPDSDEEPDEDSDEDLPRGTLPPEEEDLFARELAKLMAETGPSGGGPDTSKKSGALERGLPYLRKPGTIEATTALQTPAEAEGQAGMRFTLLTNKGNKQQARTMHIPASAPIAVHTRTQQEQDRVEQQQLKRLVLQYERREQAEERKTLQADLARRGVNVRFTNG